MPGAFRLFAALLDQAVVAGGNLLMAIAIGRMIGAEALGAYTLLFTALLLTSAMQDAALSTSFLTRKAELTASEVRRYAAACLAVAVAFSAVCAGTAGVLLLATLGGVSATFWEGWIAVCLIPAFLLRENMRRYEFAFLRMGAALQLDAIATGLQLVIVGTLLLTGAASLSMFLLAMAIGNGLACLLTVVRRRGEFDLHRMPVREVFRDIIRLSRWVVLAHIFLIIGFQMMPWLIGFQLNVKAAGEYAACSTIANAANPMITGFINTMMPRAGASYAGGPSAIWRALRHDVVILTLFSAVFCAVTMIFSDVVVGLVFGMRYTGSASLLRLLLATFFIRTLEVGPYIGCWALRRPEWNAICNAINIGVGLVVAIAMMPRFGLVGAGIGLFVGGAAGVGLRCAIFLKLCFVHPLGNPQP